MFKIPQYKIQLVRESSALYETHRVDCPDNAAAIITQYLDHPDREHLVALLLDVKNNVIGINTVAVGSATAAVVHPREVFKPAILANATAIILTHNHLSGDVTPSRDDDATTRKIKEAGKLLDIPLLDHIIVSHCPEHYYSYKANRRAVDWEEKIWNLRTD